MMSKKYLNFSVIFLMLLAIFSCSQDDTDYPIGESWIDSNTQVFYIDTLTVKSSTFKFDSIITEGSSRLLLGAYTDNVFGFTSSEIYSQFFTTDFSLDTEAEFDSIAIILKYDNYFYNDTTATQKFSIYSVEEDIKQEEDYYYNTTTLNTSSISIGEGSYKVNPISEDSLHITLNNSYGSELFYKIVENEINNSDEFLQEYKGIYIKPDENNTAILGFTTDSFIRIYYTIESETEDEEYTYDIPFYSSNTFHHIENDITNTIFNSIEDQETYLASTDLANESYIQSGTGIVTRVSIPYLERINDINGDGSFIDANLKLTLKKNSSTDNLSTRDSLNVYIIDQDSNVLEELTDYYGNSGLGIISEENTEFGIVTYNIPVKYFIERKLSEVNGENWYLAIYAQDYNSCVDRYIFYGEEEQDEELKLKLELTYAIYDE